MNPDARPGRGLRVARRTGVVLLAASTLAAAAYVPFAGRLLVVEDALQRSDAIFVLAGARVERWLEGYDLYREGWAPRIALSPGYEEPAEDVLRGRGVRFPREVELVQRALAQLRVPPDAILTLPHDVDNTAQEAAAIRRVCGERGWTRLIVVTSRYHSRRARLAFRREFAGTGVDVAVRGSRYDRATPERWWRRRDDIRRVAVETPKLVLYRLGLGG